MFGPYRALEKKLGYHFRRRRNLEAALTHRSYRFEQPDLAGDNQRLEFLGDAALNLVAADHLYASHPDVDEGSLTQMRSALTSCRALAAMAREIGLGEYLRLGKGERVSGGAERESNLEDALEAVIGAAYLERGLKAVEKIFKRLFAPKIDHEASSSSAANPKGALQEICQRMWKTGPQYAVASEAGPGHARRYTVEVRVGDRVLARAEGLSKKQAEVAAATRALLDLDPQSHDVQDG